MRGLGDCAAGEEKGHERGDRVKRGGIGGVSFRIECFFEIFVGFCKHGRAAPTIVPCHIRGP